MSSRRYESPVVSCLFCKRLAWTPGANLHHQRGCTPEIASIKENVRLTRNFRKVINREKQYQKLR
jgi:hypothetical protein